MKKSGTVKNGMFGTEKTLQTVFTNSKIGKEMQRYWLVEFQEVLVKNHREQNSDFVLIVPTETNQANAVFCNFSDVTIIDAKVGGKIINYALKNRGKDKMVVVFLNLEGRVSYYTMKTK